MSLDDVALMCEVYEGAFTRRGDKSAPLKAIRKSLNAGRLPPEWAVGALHAAMREVETYKAASWDEVFGEPHKGRKLIHLRKQYDLEWEVLIRVNRLRRQRPKPTDIFRRVAAELNISPATCKRYFDQMYQFRKPRK